MIFKELGEVRKFVISPHFILCAFLFLVFYIAATIYFTNKYFDARRINRIQTDKIARLSKELVKTRKSLQRSEEKIALLNDYISEGEDQTPEVESKIDYTESPLPKIVDVDEVKVKRAGSTLNVTFRIVNRQLSQEPIGGYIFVLTGVKDSDQSEVWVYPSSPLKDGLPVNYRKGRRFLIQRFKTMRGRYTLDKSIDGPLILEILVYDREGVLILKKVVEV